MAEKPDTTLEELRRELAGRGVPAAYGSVWRFCRRRERLVGKL